MPRKKKPCVDCDKLCSPMEKTVDPRCMSCRNIFKKENGADKKSYARFWWTKKKYDIDESGFDALWSAFKGKCGICGIDMTLPTKTRGQALTAVCIDHDHKTGNLRGLLCGACNRTLGLLKDDKNICLNAYKWLGGN